MIHKLHRLLNHQTKIHVTACLLLALILFLVSARQDTSYANTGTTAADSEVNTQDTEPELGTILIGGLDFKRSSRTKIKLSWPQTTDIPVVRYQLQRRKPVTSGKAKKWKTIETIEAASIETDAKLTVTDKLTSSKPQQYEYRVIAETYYADDYITPKTTSILASNLMICIDPGHYAGKNAATGELSYDFAEGDFNLQLAKALKKQLKKTYGIDSFLTRTSGSITIDGYTDYKLDSAHISLRGELAATKNSDLFLSLHTNANSAMANGYETFLQPASIGKSMMIMNVPAMQSERVLTIANAIGTELSRVNYSLGIAANADFRTGTVGDVMQWTGTYNDGLDETGAVVYRLNSIGTDYYGVLRGSANVDIPGIIIEHSFHTIAEMRRLAMEEDLDDIWAKIDAGGIAEGYHFVSKNDILRNYNII